MNFLLVLSPACIVFLGIELGMYARLRQMMGMASYPAAPVRWTKIIPLWPIKLVSDIRETRYAAAAWYGHNEHLEVAAIAVTLALSGVALAEYTGDCEEFSRSGALIVILGFRSIFVGLSHAEALTSLREFIFSKATPSPPTPVPELYLAPRLSNKKAFYVSAFGTLIWGYGDLFLKYWVSSWSCLACN